MTVSPYLTAYLASRSPYPYHNPHFALDTRFPSRPSTRPWPCGVRRTFEQAWSERRTSGTSGREEQVERNSQFPSSASSSSPALVIIHSGTADSSSSCPALLASSRSPRFSGALVFLGPIVVFAALVPRWLLQPACPPRIAPRLLAQHPGLAVPPPRPTTALRPPACQSKHHSLSLAADTFWCPISSSYLCRIIVTFQLVIRLPLQAIHVPLSTPHPSALTPYTHHSYRSQLRWSRPSCRSSPPAYSQPWRTLPFPNHYFLVGGAIPSLTREYTSRALRYSSFCLHVAIVHNRARRTSLADVHFEEAAVQVE